MLNQLTFDRSEAIADALHDQEGLAIALTAFVAGLNLPSDTEHVLFALIHAQDHCRNRAAHEVRSIATQRPQEA